MKQLLQVSDGVVFRDDHPTSSWIGEPRAQGSARCVLIHRDSAAVIACPAGKVLTRAELPAPRPNTRLEHCVAVVSMGFLFG